MCVCGVCDVYVWCVCVVCVCGVCVVCMCVWCVCVCGVCVVYVMCVVCVCVRGVGVCCMCVCRGMVCVVHGSRVSSLLRKEVHRRFSSDKLCPLYFFMCASLSQQQFSKITADS